MTTLANVNAATKQMDDYSITCYRRGLVRFKRLTPEADHLIGLIESANIEVMAARAAGSSINVFHTFDEDSGVVIHGNCLP